jgi:hypothetical protein
VTEATSLQDDIGLYGDDIDDLMLEYSTRFGVDLTDYLWYFHTGEEGWNIGGLFFAPPNARVREIPITVGMLHRFATQGRWAIEYPKHDLPRWRLDILINLVVVILVFGSIGLLVICWVWQAIFGE